MYYKAHHDTINYSEIVNSKLPDSFDGFRIFFISDIHRRKINVQTIKKIKYPIDIVVIGGDLTEKGVPLKRTKENIQTLAQLHAPIYFVWGNNDYEVQPETLSKLLLEENVTILTNIHNVIKRHHHTVTLYGLNHYEIEFNNRHDAIDTSELKGDYTILLTHVPHTYYQLKQDIQNEIDLVLAGHTHGGQIRFLGLGMYQKGGITKTRHTHILVSEGYGYTLLPFRLQTNAECHVITLKRM